MDVIIWLIVAALAIVLEIISLGLTTIWFAGGAVVTAVAAHFGASWFLQIIIFAATSVTLLILTRPLAKKVLAKKEDTNIDSFIGKKVLVISDIGGSLEMGTVKMNGLEWSAVAEGEEAIEKGTYVYVKAIDGNKLIVSANE